jgi:hypothetical protein
VQQERGNVNGRKYGPDVGLHVESLDRLGRGRIRRELEHGQPPVLEVRRRRVWGELGEMPLDPFPGSPSLAQVTEVILPLAAVPGVGVRPVRFLQRAWIEMKGHQLRNPVRVGRRQQGREGGAALPPEHGRTLDARLVHDDQDVVHQHSKDGRSLG